MSKVTGNQPNILYILSDQHRADCMGHAGDGAALTPNLDRLAREGTSFTRAYCPAPVCLPSRMSMLTGRRPCEQECWTNDDILDSARPTWLHGLGAAGYRPVLTGRMHSVGPDQMRGYADRPIGDHSPGWPGLGRASLGPLSGTSGPNLSSIRLSGAGRSSYQALDSDVLKQTVAGIEAHIRDNPGQPFAISAGFILPHPPYVAAPEDYAAAAERVGPPRRTVPDDHPWIRKWRQAKKLDDATPAEIQKARIAYYALVTHLDRQVGVLLDTLDRLGVAENTLVVYLSDHGDHIGERGLFWKHTLYEDSIRVPLIMRWPGQIKAGAQIDVPVETGGLGNTILELTGAPQLPNATMHSFAGLLENRGDSAAGLVFSEYCVDASSGWAEGLDLRQRAVIDGRYKLIHFDGYPSQLFDLDADPDEVTDLSGDPAYAATLDRLTGHVTSGWDPHVIASRMRERAADNLLLRQWAQNINPPEPVRWQVKAEQNVLF